MMIFLRFLNYCFILFNSCVIPQISNHIAELVVVIGIPTKEEKAEIELSPVTGEIEISKCSK